MRTRTLAGDTGADGPGGGERGPGAPEGDRPGGAVFPAPPWWQRRAVAVLAIAAVVAVPLMVALVVLHGVRWVPSLDLAMTELRLRDVGTRNTPLIGLPGRIGSLTEQGSHPGPLSFWAMAPAYRALGSTSWAMQAAAASLHVLAIGAAVWLAHRRAGPTLAVAVGLVLAVLVRTYGTGTLTEPWNPYLPLLAWVVVLLAVWSVVDGDLAVLPVAVLAASLCMQTHIPYLGLAGGVAALAVGSGLRRAFDRRVTDRRRHEARRWLVASLGLAVVLWAPLLVDELTRSPGNLTILAEYFADPDDEPVGLRQGAELVLVHLDPWELVSERQIEPGRTAAAAVAPTGSRLPGAALLATWGVCALAAWRLRHRSLVKLHLVLAVSLLLGAFAMSRIFGFVWYYLMTWAWGINALLLVAVGWTVVVAVARRLPPGGRRRMAVFGGAALAGATALIAVATVPSASATEPPAERLSSTVRALMAPTVGALRAGVGPAEEGAAGRYLVTWTDALSFGSQGFALLSELERRGVAVGVLEGSAAPATRHRVLGARDTTAEVHFASGVWVDRWRALEGVREVAFADVRTDDERRRYARLRTSAMEELRRAGRPPDVVALMDENVFAAAIDPRVPRGVQEMASEMLELGSPAAVFVGPPPPR